MGFDQNLAQTLAMIGIFLTILQIIVFVLSAWWLFLINKKLGEEYPWLSFIPVIQLYSYCKASGKSLWWILWIIIGFIAFVIPWLILVIILLHWISKRTWRGAWTTLGLLFIPFIMFPVVWVKLQEGLNVEVSKETENKDEL